MASHAPSSIKITPASKRRERYLINEGVKPVALADWDFYNRQSPPIFPHAVQLPSLPPVQAQLLADRARLGSYYRVTASDDGYYITDAYPENECYHNRQYMLFSVYKQFIGERIPELDLVDLGGSTGYYSFHASRLGFRDVLCVEGRKELAHVFEVIRDLAKIPNVEFQGMNVESLGKIDRRFDVVLAQGIMYHTYDHLNFVRQLYRLTKRLLIIDIMLNGRMTTTLDLGEEEPDNLRDSPFSSISLVPSLPVVLRLLKAAGFREIKSVPFPARIRDSGGLIIDPFRFGQGLRIMLAAAP